MILFSTKQQAAFNTYSDRALLLLLEGFTTKAAKKSAQDNLSRAYNEVRSLIMSSLLLKESSVRDDAYYGMASDLHNWRPKHATMLLEVDARFQDLINKADELFRLREEIKSNEVTKPAPKKKATSTMSKSVGHKATHQGECQICGNVQKLPHGVLSLHGYTVDYGWFNGTCSGAKGKPYETSCDLIQAAIDSTKESIVSYAALAEELAVTTDYVWVSVYYRASSERHVTGRHAEKHNASSIISYEGEYSGGEKYTKYFVAPTHILDSEKDSYIKNPTRCAYVELGKYGSFASLDEVIVEQNKNRLNMVKNTITQMEAFIKWQEGRIATWKLQELAEV